MKEVAKESLETTAADQNEQLFEPLLASYIEPGHVSSQRPEGSSQSPIFSPDLLAPSAGAPSLDSKKNKQASSEREKLGAIEALDFVAKSPDCFEKQLVQLHAFMVLAKHGEKGCVLPADEKVSFDEAHLIERVVALGKQAKDESILLTEHFDGLSAKIKNKQWGEAHSLLSRVLDEIRPFDIELMRHLVGKTNEAVARVKDQDVVLFLGGTGAGKSTTINYLSGVEMERKRIGGVFHIVPKEAGDGPVKVGVHVGTSETRYITAVSVDKSKVKGFKGKRPLVLCDSAGFGDTAGAEVDLANSIGLVKAMQACHSVIPFILISARSVGDRFSGLKDLAHIIVQMIPSVADRIESFSYGFTKYSEEEIQDISRSLAQVQEELTEKEKADKAFDLFMDDLVEKTEDKVNAIRPLDKKPHVLLNSLNKLKGIENPKQVFKTFLTPKCEPKLVSQAEKTKYNIHSTLKRSDYLIIAYRLDQLKVLVEEVNHETVNKYYREAVADVTKHLNAYYQEEITHFDDILINDIAVLLDKDADRYKRFYDIIASTSDLRASHLEHGTPEKEAVAQHLFSKIQILLQGLKGFSLEKNLAAVKIRLDKANTMCTLFKPHRLELKALYNAACTYVNAQLQLQVETARVEMDACHFAEAGRSMSFVQKVSNELGVHLGLTSTAAEAKELTATPSLYQDLLHHLHVKFQKNFKIGEEILDKIPEIDLTKEAASALKKCLDVYRSAMDAFELREHIDEPSLKSHIEQLAQKGVSRVEALTQKIDKMFLEKKGESFPIIKGLLEQVCLLRLSPAIGERTGEGYNGTVQTLAGYLRQMRAEVNESLRTLGVVNDKISSENACKKIKEALSVIDGARWIDKLVPGTVETLKQEILNDLEHRIEHIQQQLKIQSLCLKSTPKLEEIHDGSVLKVELLCNYLEDYFPPRDEKSSSILRQRKESIESIFSGKVKETLTEIEEISGLKRSLSTQKIPEASPLLVSTTATTVASVSPSHLRHASQTGVEVPAEAKAKATVTAQVPDAGQTMVAAGGIKAGSKEPPAGGLLSTLASSVMSGLFSSPKEPASTQIWHSQQLHTPQLLAEDKFRVSEPVRPSAGVLEIKPDLSSSRRQGSPEPLSSFLPVTQQIGPQSSMRGVVDSPRTQQYEGASRRLFSAHQIADCFNYLGVCRKLPLVEKLAVQMLRGLNEHLEAYADGLENDIRGAIKLLGDAADFSKKEEIEKAGRLLVTRLREVILLKDKAELVYDYFKAKAGDESDFLEDIKETFLNKAYTGLEKALRNDKMTGNLKALEVRLMVVWAYAPLDKLFDTRFVSLHGEYAGSVDLGIQEESKAVQQAILGNDFAAIQTKLVSLSELSHDQQNPISAHELKKQTSAIVQAIDAFLEKSKVDALRLDLSHELKDELQQKAYEVATSIKSIDTIIEKLSSFVGEECIERVKQAREAIIEVVSQTLTDYLEELDAALEGTDFISAHNKHDVLRRVLSSLEYLMPTRGEVGHPPQPTSVISNFKQELLPTSFQDRLKDLLNVKQRTAQFNDLLKGQLDEIVERYKALPIDDYSLTPPSEILEKLDLVRTKSNLYLRAHTHIKTAVKLLFGKEIEILRTQISGILSTEDEDTWRTSCQRLRDALPNLPANMRQERENRLNGIQKNFDKTIVETRAKRRRQYEKVEDALKKDNVSVLRQIYTECQEDKVYSFISEQLVKDMNTKLSVLSSPADQKKPKPEKEKLVYMHKYFEAFHDIQGERFLPVREAFSKQLKAHYLAIFDFSRRLSSLTAHDEFMTNPKTIEQLTASFIEIAAFIHLHESAHFAEYKLLPAEAKNFSATVPLIFRDLVKQFSGLSNAARGCVAKRDYETLRKVFSSVLSFSPLVEFLKTYFDGGVLTKLEGIQALSEAAFGFTSLALLGGQIVKLIQSDYQDLLSTNLLDPRTKKTVEEREAFYEGLNSRLLALDSAKALKDEKELVKTGALKDIDFVKLSQEAHQKLRDQVVTLGRDVVSRDLDKLFNSDQAACDRFSIVYQNLSVLAKKVPSLDTVVEDSLEQMQTGLISRIDAMEREGAAKLENLEELAALLVRMKYAADRVYVCKEIISHRMDRLLASYKEKRGVRAIVPLALVLNQDVTGVGRSLVSEHSQFKGYAIMMFNTKTDRRGINEVLSEIKGTSKGSVEKIKRMKPTAEADGSSLQELYQKYELKYKSLTEKGLREAKDPSGEFLNELVATLKLDTQKLQSSLRTTLREQKLVSITKKASSIPWRAVIRQDIPLFVATIAALWTLKNATHYMEAGDVTNRSSYLMQPHAAQILSIFRMLNLDASVDSAEIKLENNLVEIRTGEGKSITLAITSAVLALLGCQVNCACYSDYLSQRDREAFQWLFDLLGVSDQIHYGTFNNLCERVINQEGDLRKRVLGLISKGEVVAAPESKSRFKVLLIDEVDVFFKKDFYGNLYLPSAVLKDETVNKLIDHIWVRRNDRLTLKGVKETPEYLACAEKFKGFEVLIDEAIKDMIAAAKDFGSHHYEVHNDKICYKDQDTLSSHIVYGYQTLFAYYHEHAKGKISEKSLQESRGLDIYCGKFSYGEIPHLFNCIMGVTGTLRTLSEPETKIVRETYGIDKYTFAPSIYEDNGESFDNIPQLGIVGASSTTEVTLASPIVSETKLEEPTTGTAYFRALSNTIREHLVPVGGGAGKRAVMVFFASTRELDLFYESSNFAEMRSAAICLTEGTDDREKLALIKRATTQGQITLMTKSFGRGIDFVCYDEALNACGGPHVIQTFLSEEISEEVQIKGRTARQGGKGSYELLLFDTELEKFLVTKDEIKGTSKSERYALVHKKREDFFRQQYENNIAHAGSGDVVTQHQDSMNFVATFNRYAASKKQEDLLSIKTFLLKQNIGATLNAGSRTVVLMDATGSMGHLIQKAKNAVSEMFSRALKVLEKVGIKEGFEMQFVVYRNYNAPAEKLLEASSWESKPEKLRQFMDTIGAEYGYGPGEAVEIGLWHVSQELRAESQVTQVLLIGDQPANTTSETLAHRSRLHGGEPYWSKTRFAAPTSCEAEIKAIGEHKIPVHTFFVNGRTQASFEAIAKQAGNGSKSALLDVNSPKGAEMLTDSVTEEILRDQGNRAGGQGDKLVELYRKEYSKAYRS